MSSARFGRSLALKLSNGQPHRCRRLADPLPLTPPARGGEKERFPFPLRGRVKGGGDSIVMRRVTSAHLLIWKKSRVIHCGRETV